MASKDKSSKKDKKEDRVEERHKRYNNNVSNIPYSSKHKDERDRKHKKHKKSEYKKDKKKKHSSSRDRHSKKHKSKKKKRRHYSDDSSMRSGSASSSSLDGSKDGKKRKRDSKEERKSKDDSDSDKTPAATMPTVPNLSSLSGIEGENRKLTIKDFPNYKKKIVVSNLPINASEDEIFTFFNTYINTLRPLFQNEEDEFISVPHETEELQVQMTNNFTIIDKIEIKEGHMRYAAIQLSNKEDIENCVTLDGTEWKGNKIRVRRPKKFIEEYNKIIDQRLGLVPLGSVMNNPMLPNQAEDSEHKIYMGGIPTTMSSEEVRKLCAGFGLLKSFNLVVDPSNKRLNKGFAFFEYTNEKDTEKAIKALDGFEIMDKKLKVQRASIGAKAPAVNKMPTTMGFQNYVDPKERIKIPLYALTPSRVVQFLNIIAPEDLLDEAEKKEALKDLCAE